MHLKSATYKEEFALDSSELVKPSKDLIRH